MNLPGPIHGLYLLPLLSAFACGQADGPTSRNAEPGGGAASPAPTPDGVAPATPPARFARPIELVAVKPTDVIFIGRPAPSSRLACGGFDAPDAPHRRPPRPLNDATDYPQRHLVSIEIVEVVQGPGGLAAAPSANRRPAGRPVTATVAWSLGPDAFPEAGALAPDAYDAAYCGRVNQTLGAAFVVVHGFPIHVDRGNAQPDLWREAWESIGTGLGTSTAGFATLEEARAYASSLPGLAVRARTIKPLRDVEALRALLKASLKVDGARLAVSEEFVMAAFASPTLVAKEARFAAVTADGQPALTIAGIRPGSIFALLGFEKGDQVLALNEIALVDPERALAVLTRLRDASELRFTIRRRGQSMSIEIQVVPTTPGE